MTIIVVLRVGGQNKRKSRVFSQSQTVNCIPPGKVIQQGLLVAEATACGLQALGLESQVP